VGNVEKRGEKRWSSRGGVIKISAEEMEMGGRCEIGESEKKIENGGGRECLERKEGFEYGKFDIGDGGRHHEDLEGRLGSLCFFLRGANGWNQSGVAEKLRIRSFCSERDSMSNEKDV
jgi:hypothetical protein